MPEDDRPLALMAEDMKRRGSGYRKGVKDEVDKKAPLDDQGNMICMGCGEIMNPSTVDHYPTWADRIRNRIYNSRKEVLNDWNSTNEQPRRM